jgi:hypothetical protein
MVHNQQDLPVQAVAVHILAEPSVMDFNIVVAAV